MKKYLAIAVLMLMTIPAHADLIGGRERSQNMKLGASQSQQSQPKVSNPFIDPQSILDYVAAFLGNAGTREGVYYDTDENEWGNYVAATVYTIPDTGVAFDIGMLDLDGVAATVDLNIGSIIPADSAPVLNMLNYLYIGGGVGYRDIDQANGSKQWNFSPILDAQFKVTF